MYPRSDHEQGGKRRDAFPPISFFYPPESIPLKASKPGNGFAFRWTAAVQQYRSP